MEATDLIELGKTDIKVTRIGIGIMQWGGMPLGQAGSEGEADTMDIYRTAQEGGINFFDTAEMYGSGKSETHLGRCLQNSPANIVVATKFMPFPWRISKSELRAALLRSLKRLGLPRVDVYQMHWPYPPVSIPAWMEAMSAVLNEGLIRAVGVSNYSPRQTRQAFETLAKHNIPLASNQVKYSLLDRRPERSGLVDLCRELGVTIIAYSPLEKGMLSGKYSAENIPPGYRAWRYNKNYLFKIKPLLDTIRQIGEAHGGVTSGQVALNWLVCKGAVPIPGARTKNQAHENAGALGWQLSSEEVIRLDRISEEVTR